RTSSGSPTKSRYAKKRSSMISQMGSLDCPASLDSASAARLAGSAFTSAILTYFGLIVTNGSVFAKGSCGFRLAVRAPLPKAGLEHIESSGPTQNGPGGRKEWTRRGHDPAGPV